MEADQASDWREETTVVFHLKVGLDLDERDLQCHARIKGLQSRIISVIYVTVNLKLTSDHQAAGRRAAHA